MFIVILYGLITVASVIIGLKKQKLAMFAIPFVSIFGYMVYKIALVPMPFMETVRFIFDLR